MTKILSASEVKAKFYKLIDGVAVGDEVIVTKNGKPTVAILNAEELSSLKETLEVLSDPELMRQIRAGEKAIQGGARLYSFEEVFGEPLVVRDRSRRRHR